MTSSTLVSLRRCTWGKTPGIQDSPAGPMAKGGGLQWLLATPVHYRIRYATYRCWNYTRTQHTTWGTSGHCLVQLFTFHLEDLATLDTPWASKCLRHLHFTLVRVSCGTCSLTWQGLEPLKSKKRGCQIGRMIFQPCWGGSMLGLSQELKKWRLCFWKEASDDQQSSPTSWGL